MIKPALLLLALIALALLVRLDRDGILAHSDAVAHALGVELRIEVTVRRSPAVPVTRLAPVARFAPTAPAEVPSCE